MLIVYPALPLSFLQTTLPYFLVLNPQKAFAETKTSELGFYKPTMVLSNKKLKQKLRAAKVESLTITESNALDLNKNGASTTNPDANSELKELLEAAKQKPRLSKREKRRKTLSLQGFDNKKVEKNEGSEDGSKGDLVGSEENSDEMKRKRKGEKGEREEKGDVEGYEAVKEVKKAKNKNNKKKKLKKKEEIEEGKIGFEAKSMNGIGESQANEDVATRVYVGGIPYYSTEDDIRSFFESCGTITDVDCMKFPDSGKFRGIAIISFKTEAAAKRALALEGADMGGFYLKIQPYKTTRANKVSNFAPEIVKGYNRVYVGNLSWDITEDDLRNFFSDCKISCIRFGMDKETGEFRGYGHVDFSDNLSLMMALKLDQQIVCGRPIKISCAVPKKGAKIHVPDAPTRNEANNEEVSSTSGKIRRRTCYECGEKGHISTACPKKQAAEPINVNTS